MSGAGFHNPLYNQLQSPRHMGCGDLTIKGAFILTGCHEYLYISVCIWYEDSFTPMKRSNAHEVTLRAVLEILFVCLCPHWDATRDSVCVCVRARKENLHLINMYYQRMWAEHSGEHISEGDQLYHSMSQHSSATANRNKYTNVT